MPSEIALCAGLPTPHILRPEVSREPPETFGQVNRRGQETRAERWDIVLVGPAEIGSEQQIGVKVPAGVTLQKEGFQR